MEIEQKIKHKIGRCILISIALDGEKEKERENAS